MESVLLFTEDDKEILEGYNNFEKEKKRKKIFKK